MRKMIALCLLFAMLSSTHAQRRLSKSPAVPDIYSILAKERLKYDHSAGPVTDPGGEPGRPDIRKQINILKKIKGLGQGTFTYMVAKQDSFIHQTWTSTTAAQTTK